MRFKLTIHQFTNSPINRFFLSHAEASFYRVLQTAVGGRFLIWPKVNLSDIFFVPRASNDLAYRNKIDPKHVDFLLCHPAGLRPLVAIELDDASHQQGRRMERDQFVNRYHHENQ